MIEIILLVLLSKRVALYAESKGYVRSHFRAFAVLGWIIGELLGALCSLAIFGQPTLEMLLFMFTGAAVGMGAVYLVARKLPYKENAEVSVPPVTPPASEPSAPPPSPSRQWVCPACDFNNGYWAETCYNCTEPKPPES